MSFTPIPENSAATPGLWNTRFQELDSSASLVGSELSARLAGYNAGTITSNLSTTGNVAIGGNLTLPAGSNEILTGGSIFLRQSGAPADSGIKMYCATNVNSFSTTSLSYLVIEQPAVQGWGGIQILPGSGATAVANGRNNQILMFGVSGANYERFGITYFAGDWVITSDAQGSGTTRGFTFSTTGGVDMRMQSTGSTSFGTSGVGWASRVGVDGQFQAHTMLLSHSTATLNLNQGRLLSVRTVAASAVTVSAGNTNVRADEILFSVGGASGASLIIHSGGTLYIFSSALSAKAT